MHSLAMRKPLLHRFGQLVLVIVAAATNNHSIYTFAACPPGDCQPHGQCVLDTLSCGDDCQERCVCYEGFAGRSCAFLVEVCPSVADDDAQYTSARACFNGGTCYSAPSDTNNSSVWKCDCSGAVGGSTNATGDMCEYTTGVVSCELGTLNSDYAFCVNGGTCGNNTVNSGEVFQGCTCPSQSEGLHCQFAAGTVLPGQNAFVNETTMDIANETFRNTSSSDNGFGNTVSNSNGTLDQTTTEQLSGVESTWVPIRRTYRTIVAAVAVLML